MNKNSHTLRIILFVLIVAAIIGMILIVTGVIQIRTPISQFRSGGIVPFNTSCQCYCSDKCGPRNIKQGIDRPFVDSETGICFCADRDKINYIPNRCTPKSFSNSCCA